MLCRRRLCRYVCCLSVRWAGFGNLRAGQLVVANLSQCSMDEAGSSAVLAALEPQAQSLGTLIVSGNRLQERGTRGLNKLLGGDAVSLQVGCSRPSSIHCIHSTGPWDHPLSHPAFDVWRSSRAGPRSAGA